MIDIGYKPIASDHSLFLSEDKHILTPIYVDDFMIYRPAFRNSSWLDLKKALTRKFGMTEKGNPTYYLGMKSGSDPRMELSKINQPRHLAELLR